MSKTNQTLREILLQVWDCGYTIDTPDTQGMSVDQALKEISELLVECEPEEEVVEDLKGQIDYGYMQGWNACRDDYEKNIKDLLQ